MNSEKMTKRQERRARLERQQQIQRLVVIGLIVLGTSLLVLAIAWPYLNPSSEPTATALPSAVSEIVTIVPETFPNADGLSLGAPNASVIIDVFEDFQCPACQYFTQTVEPLVIENLVDTGKARYVYHNYPFLDDRMPEEMEHESDQAANASMCANEQGKFWEMHGTIFANWNGENEGAYSAPRLQAMAESIGLDMQAFNECLTTDKYKAEVQADFELGKQMGVSGTPTVFVNGQQAGQPDRIATYDDIAQAVEQALTK